MTRILNTDQSAQVEQLLVDQSTQTENLFDQSTQTTLVDQSTQTENSLSQTINSGNPNFNPVTQVNNLEQNNEQQIDLAKIKYYLGKLYRDFKTECRTMSRESYRYKNKALSLALYSSYVGFTLKICGVINAYLAGHLVVQTPLFLAVIANLSLIMGFIGFVIFVSYKFAEYFTRFTEYFSL